MFAVCSLQTVFYFDIQQKNFREALDRFANFFIKPLLKRDSMDREILAVDSGQLHAGTHGVSLNLHPSVPIIYES